MATCLMLRDARFELKLELLLMAAREGSQVKTPAYGHVGSTPFALAGADPARMEGEPNPRRSGWNGA